jgi:hypothetical protein
MALGRDLFTGRGEFGILMSIFRRFGGPKVGTWGKWGEIIPEYVREYKYKGENLFSD